MATPTAPLTLVHPTTNYCDYFAHTETDTFRGHYTTVLTPYANYSIDTIVAIDTIYANGAATPDDVARLIYAVYQVGIPIKFLKWHQGVRVRGAQIALLHSV